MSADQKLGEHIESASISESSKWLRREICIFSTYIRLLTRNIKKY